MADFSDLYDKAQELGKISEKGEKALRKAAKAVYEQLVENREALIAAAREIEGEVGKRIDTS